ncbi:MAG: arylsulfatase [Bacteroidales bacterium]
MKKLFLLPLIGATALQAQNIKKPNVIVVIADDLGYGDVSAYGSKTIHTPNIDRLAKGGISFNNGYATSATSTPSRYALLTGMYPWKKDGAKILPGDAPLLISVDQYTLPKMMKQAGYVTAAIGKWHLGMGSGNPDWNKTVTPGANQVGFDYSCLIAATVDRVPTVYLENGNVVGLDPKDPIYVSYKKNFEGEPTALTNPELVKMQWSHGHNNSVINGIPRIGFMKGGKSAIWKDDEMAGYLFGKVKTFLDEEQNHPFFLYYGLHEPHVPRVPNSQFVGKSGMGPRGDAILEADWCVGQLLDHLEKLHLLDNTIIIFSSDNGPVLDDGYKDGAAEMLGNHKPAGDLRGGKYSLFDAGTHVPFFVYWKNTIKPKVSDALVCQMDLLASLSAMLNQPLKGNFDSQNILPALLGKSNKGRTELVVEANEKMALRYENWAMIPPYKGPQRNETGNELGNLPDYGLFNLSTDDGQKNNVATKEPGELEKLKSIFFKITKGYYKSEVEEIQLK